MGTKLWYRFERRIQLSPSKLTTYLNISEGGVIQNSRIGVQNGTEWAQNYGMDLNREERDAPDLFPRWDEAPTLHVLTKCPNHE